MFLVECTLYFFYDFISLTSLLLPKWSSDLKYGPCPPARDFGSRVSGLVFLLRSFYGLSEIELMQINVLVLIEVIQVCASPQPAFNFVKLVY